MSTGNPSDSIRADIHGNVAGQVAVGNYILQVGPVHGGIVNIAAPGQPVQPRPRPTPVLLPPRPIRGWLDRRSEITTALAAIRSGLTVEVSGQPGVGKTALLRYLAHTSEASGFSDGIVYLGARPLDDLLQAVFDAFYETPAPYKPTNAELHLALRDRKALLLLDDVSLAASDLDALLDAVPGCSVVLATAHRSLWGEVQPIQLHGLPPEDAIVLVERELGRPVEEVERPAAAALVGAVGGHPIRLLQAAARSREPGGSLEDVSREAQAASSGTEATERMLASLDVEDRRVVAALVAIGDAGLTSSALAAVAGVAEADSRVTALVRRRIIEARRNRYVLAPGIAAAAQHAPFLPNLIDRAIDVLVAWAQAHRNDRASLAEESAALVVAQQRAAERSRWKDVLRIGLLLAGALLLGGQWAAWAAVLDRNLQAARAIGDAASEALALHEAGTRALCLGDKASAQSLLSQALGIRQRIGDAAGAAASRHNLNLMAPPVAPDEPSHPPQDGIDDLDLHVDPVVVQQQASRAIGPVVSTALALFIAAAGGVGWWWTRTPVAAPPEAPQVVVEPPPQPLTDPAPPAPVPAEPMRVAITPGETQFGTNVLRVLAGPRELLVSNLGGAPVAIADVALSGDNALDFSIRENGCRLTLANGDSCRVAIGFTPSAEGVRNAVVTITGQDGASRWAARLVGAGIPPERPRIDVPVELKFGSRMVKTVGGLEELKVVNPGSASLTIARAEKSGDHGDDFTVLEDKCSGTTLARLGECVIRVRFAPSGVGPRAGRLTIVDNGEGNPHIVALLGEGSIAPTPLPRVIPEILEFTPRVVQQPGASAKVTVANDGNGPLVIGRVTMQGIHASDFRIVRNSCEGTTVPAPGACEIEVGFAPVGVGPRTASLALEHNAGDTGNSVALLGTALTPPRPVPQVKPPIVAFDRRLQGSESASQPVSVTNIGGGTLVVGRVAVTGEHAADFLLENNCAASKMARGENCELSVRFVPQGVGPRRAELVLADNSGDVPQRVALTGRADRPGVLEVTPPRVDFDAQKLGAAVTSPTITARNGGTLSVTLDPVSVIGPNATDFTLSRTCREQTLPGGSSCALEVRFAPTAHGPRTATLRLSTADGTSREVALSGSGLGSGELVVPASLRLGVAELRSTTPPQRVSVRNDGTAPVTLGTLRLDGDAREFQIDPGNDCARATLQPKGSCAIDVMFTPLAASTRTATLVIAEATGPLHPVALAGEGRMRPPDPPVTPPSPPVTPPGPPVTPGGNDNGPRPRLPEILSFRAVRGGLCYSVDGVTLGSINPGVGPVAVGLDERCTSISPERTTTYLLTVENGVGRAQRAVTVAVTGGGGPPPPPKEAQLRFLPDRLALGPVVGTTNPGAVTLSQNLPRQGSIASDTFTIRNVGEAAATISRFELDGRDRSDFSVTPSPACRRLEAGQECEVRVAFRPSESGTSSATVLIDHNAPRSPDRVLLTGVARDGGVTPKPPAIEFQPARIEFGPWYLPPPPTARGLARSALPPAAAPREIRVRNRGGSAATIADVRVEGANAREFAVSGSCARIEPGGECGLTVSFRPVGSPGSRAAVVAMDHNAPGSPRQVALTGDVRYREDPGGGDVERPAPRILSFEVQGGAGKWALCYEIANADRAFISPMGRDVPVGARRQCVPVSPPPVRTTSYQLTAVGPGGQDRESTTIQVKGTPGTGKDPDATSPGGRLSQPDPTLKRPITRTPPRHEPETRQPPPPARPATRQPPPPARPARGQPPPPAEKGTVR